MAKKKKKAAAAAAKAEAEAPPAAKAKSEPPAAKPAPEAAPADEGDDAQTQDKFRAAAVVFFTRDDKGSLDRVLVAVEERKAQATYFDMGTSGKVVVDCIVFPMGRREKKDKSDPVDTARREYVEETGDYGGYSQYLEIADFADEDDEASKAELDARGAAWTGRNNLAVYFAPAAMVVLFCEVPAKALAKSHRRAVGGVLISDMKPAASEGDAAEAAEADQAADDGAPAKKKRKKEAPAKPSPNYHVGRTDHLEPFWVNYAELRAAIETGAKAPKLMLGKKECRVFPMVSSILRMPEVVAWMKSASAKKV